MGRPTAGDARRRTTRGLFPCPPHIRTPSVRSRPPDPPDDRPPPGASGAILGAARGEKSNDRPGISSVRGSRCRSRTSDGAGAWSSWRRPSCTPRASAPSALSVARRRPPPRVACAAAAASGTEPTRRSRLNRYRRSSRPRACSGARTIPRRAFRPVWAASGGRRGGTCPPSSPLTTTTTTTTTTTRPSRLRPRPGSTRTQPQWPPSSAR